MKSSFDLVPLELCLSAILQFKVKCSRSGLTVKKTEAHLNKTLVMGNLSNKTTAL